MAFEVELGKFEKSECRNFFTNSGFKNHGTGILKLQCLRKNLNKTQLTY